MSRGRRGRDKADAEVIEHVARVLLRRYGVVCWRLLEREAAWLPPWRDLVRVYRRLEARGEIRGGRFIAGLTGEQFALPEAIAQMREVRRRPADDALVCLGASDPANLLGTVVPGAEGRPRRRRARAVSRRRADRDERRRRSSRCSFLATTASRGRDALRHGPAWRALIGDADTAIA